MTAQKLSLRIRINWRTFFLLHRQNCNLWMQCEHGSRKRWNTRQIPNNFIPGLTIDSVCTSSQLPSLSLTGGQHFSFKINLQSLMGPYEVAAIASCFLTRTHCFKICLFMSLEQMHKHRNTLKHFMTPTMLFDSVTIFFKSQWLILSLKRCRFHLPVPVDKNFVVFLDQRFSPSTVVKILRAWGFPGGTVVENLPANAGDTGSSPGLGRSHMPQSN